MIGCHCSSLADFGLVQIDEFIGTGTLAALNQAEASAEGGDAPQKEQAVAGKAKDMAAKFL